MKEIFLRPYGLYVEKLQHLGLPYYKHSALYKGESEGKNYFMLKILDFSDDEEACVFTPDKQKLNELEND
jgi:hypothetical protein